MASAQQVTPGGLALAVRECARVGAIYGVTETALLVFRPWWLRYLIAAYLPTFVSSSNPPGISAEFAAVVLVACPLVGAVFGLVMYLIAVLAARLFVLIRSADPAWFWSSLGSFAWIVAFVIAGLWRGRLDVLPAIIAPLVLIAVRLLSAWRPRLRPLTEGIAGPWLVVFLLVGGAYTAQARAQLPILTRNGLAIGFPAAVLVLVWVLQRHLTRGWARHVTGAARGRALSRVALPAASCLLLLASGVRFEPSTSPWPAAKPRAGTDGPNVILITLDTVRADHLSLYGYGRDTTPTLRTWARNDVAVYRAAFAASNHTLPSHASIFSGLAPHRHGALITDDFPAGLPIASQVVTLPTRLAEAGYLTVGIAANSEYLKSSLGFGRGFAYYRDDCPIQAFGPVPPYLFAESIRELLATLFRSVNAEPAFWRAEEVNARAFDFLGTVRDGKQPFFLFLNYMDAHVPYVPPPPFSPGYGGEDPPFRWFAYGSLRDAVAIHRSRRLDDRTRNYLTSQYDGAITYLDSKLGDLLSRLKDLGLYDNSLIIVTSDHGEGLGERSLLGHGLSVYQHELLVPLLVKYPHATTATAEDVPVSSVDVTPTILDVVGIAAPPDLDGMSLRRAELHRRGTVVAESSAMRPVPGQPGVHRPAEIALTTGVLKLIWRADGAAEAYSLSDDPTEQRDLIRTAALPEGWPALLAGLTAAVPRTDASSPTDPTVLERLKSLGYVR